jgi:lipopolysaccharide transport system ATP-binding protein
VKIYAWGTLNSDTAGQSEYWNKIYKKDTLYTIEFIADCALGENLYEVQAALMQYDIPDYNLGSSRIISWQDEAAFFRVIQDRELNFFGGVCDLRMQANEVPV